MQEFVLPVTLNGKELNFNARLIQFGYVYKIEVDVSDVKVQLERDENGEWRALSDGETFNQNKIITKELIEAIVAAIDFITK